MEDYKVYVRVNELGYITAVNSSAFINNTGGWLEIDHGRGDKYCHAMGNYFPKTVHTELGAYRYKLVDGVPAECTTEEIMQQETALSNSQSNEPSVNDILNALLGVTE